MPRRGVRRKRNQSHSDSDEDLDPAAAVLESMAATSERRVRTNGVSAEALQTGETARSTARLETTWGVVAGGKTQADALEKRMEDFVQAGLKEAFHLREEDEAQAEGPSLVDLDAAAADDVPDCLQTKAIAEVSVPGFNTAITEFKLDSETRFASGEIIQGDGKLTGPASQHSRTAGAKQVPGVVPYVPRDQFPSTFGKRRKKTDDSGRNV